MPPAVVTRSVGSVSTRHAMSTADAAWLRMDRPTNLMIVNSVLWFDEPVDWDRCRAVFLERLVARFDRFRQRAVDGLPLAGPHWQDDLDFDPDLHFHHVSLPAPHDRAALEEFVGDRASTPLDHSRPLWEVYLIDDYGSGCAILVRIHHCVADGIALARVMLTLTDGGEPDAGITPGTGHDGGLRLPALGAAARLAGSVVHEGVETLLHPAHAGTLASAAVGDAQTLAKLLLPGSDPQSAIKGEQSIAHRVAWSDPVPLWRVKRAGRAHDATVNDVLVTAVAGAIGRHLREFGDDVGEVHALVPFNLRPLDQPLPRELGNRFGLVLLGLPVGIEDPVERLAEVKRWMDAIKHGHEGVFTFGILSLMGRTPVQVEERLIDFFSAKGSMVLTNVPGPRQGLSLAGTPLSGVLVWAPCSGSVGMSVSVFSYAGKVTVGFLTDAGLVPEPQQLADRFKQDLLALARAA
jgi:diacylglycerol O-acyltransferase / wax synthase